MNRLSRLLIIIIALILAVPLAVPAAPVVQAQDGGPRLRDGEGADFWVPLTPLEPENIESVIAPADSRRRVRDTTSLQYRWVVKLEMLYGTDLYLCSGWLIGPRLVATAGHCVYNGGWADSIRVIPAQNETNEPYGYQMAYDWGAPSEWITGPDPNYDFGFVVLPDMTMGSMVGVYQNVGWFSDYFLNVDLKSQVNVTGYPGDKLVNGNTAWTMWTDKDPLVATTSKMAHYTVDTYGGQSGSAVWTDYKGHKFAAAVHAYGVGSGSPCYVSSSFGVSNCGPRIDEAWLDYLNNTILFFYPDAVPAGEFYTDMILGPSLVSPVDGALTNDKVLFSWNPHPDAVKYELEIWKWNEKTYTYKRIIRKKTTDLSWLKSLGTGVYIWRVRIEQANKFPGQWSENRYLEVDKKKPKRPVLIWPPNNTVVASPFFTEWSAMPDLDIDYFRWQINDKKASGWNSPLAEFAIAGTSTSTVVSGPDGTYYWRVSAVDVAGNQGPWSKVWKVTLGPSTSISIGGEPSFSAEGAIPRPAPRTHSSRIPAIISLDGESQAVPGLSTQDAGVPVIPID